MSDEDEMIADLDRLVRAAVMAGSQLGERLIRSRAERDRQAAALTREDTRQHQLQDVAHRDVARAVHRQVGDPQFWEGHPRADRSDVRCGV